MNELEGRLLKRITHKETQQRLSQPTQPPIDAVDVVRNCPREQRELNDLRTRSLPRPQVEHSTQSRPFNTGEGPFFF